jgi:hypothetical protein
MSVVVQGTDYVQLPVGTTGQRSLTPVIGMMRVNTTTNALEVYTGTVWLTWKAF